MIEFLFGAFSVLRNRGERIVKILYEKRDVPHAVGERCRRVAEHTLALINEIDEKSATLESIKTKLAQNRVAVSEADVMLKSILLSYRDLRRNTDAIEENFVGHIVRFNEADLFFTKLAEALWEETNLPDLPPVAVTNTSGYFCTLASLGIVFSPPSTEHNLLILLDFYHESGHILNEQIELFGANFRSELAAHIAGLKNQIRRVSRPLPADIIDRVNLFWNNRWAEEVACDTLAACLVGPAYGWCNLHLCLQNSNAFDFSVGHPADAARTKHILRVLRRRGFAGEADEIESRWKRYIDVARQTPTNYYQDYHPDGIFIAVMEDVEQIIVNYDLTGIETRSPMIAMFNEAWTVFVNDNQHYNDWEAKTIGELNAKFGINN